MAPDATRKLSVIAAGKPATLQYDATTFSVRYADGKHNCDVALKQVIWATVADDTMEVCFLARKKKSDPLLLRKVDGTVKDTEGAKDWAETLMTVAYEGIETCRRLKVLVNPFGGLRKGPSIFIKYVEPILRSARCVIDVTYTTHARHAYEIAKELKLDYDSIVTVSGDGVIHEVLNGLADHERRTEALAIPIAPIPTGTGNGLSLNLHGLEHGFDVGVAALNVIKGRPMKSDLFSVVEGSKRTYSFLSQALGLMADVDAKTENLRWMGDARFMLGFVRGVAQLQPCPIQLSIQVVENDKHAMANNLKSRREAGGEDVVDSTPAVTTSKFGPPLKPSPEDGPGWYIFDRPLIFVYAGQGPFVARDYMAFPVSAPDDGFIDLAVQEMTSRGDLLGAISGAEKGLAFWRDSTHYFKASAYRVKPLKPKGYFTIDGEIGHIREYEVEVHPQLASFLSPLGYYAPSFTSHGGDKRGKASQK